VYGASEACRDRTHPAPPPVRSPGRAHQRRIARQAYDADGGRIVASFDGSIPSAKGAGVSIGRYSTPEEIASGILWLSSPGAASAIGAVLAIDAGFTAA
jgi:NAD(P)-dependent dehydrogenase (short-subunit alcohol dehydrogenase family)